MVKVEVGGREEGRNERKEAGKRERRRKEEVMEEARGGGRQHLICDSWPWTSWKEAMVDWILRRAEGTEVSEREEEKGGRRVIKRRDLRSNLWCSLLTFFRLLSSCHSASFILCASQLRRAAT